MKRATYITFEVRHEAVDLFPFSPAVLQVGGNDIALVKWRLFTAPYDFDVYFCALADAPQGRKSKLRRLMNDHEWRLQFDTGEVLRGRDLRPTVFDGLQW